MKGYRASLQVSVKRLRISLGFAWRIPDVVDILCVPKMNEIIALESMSKPEDPIRNPMVLLGRFMGFLSPVGLVFRANST